MTTRTVIVNRDDGVLGRFHHCANGIHHALLHFRIGALDGIEFDRIAILACCHGGNSAATHADTVVIAAHHHNLIAGFKFFLFRVFFFCETNAPGEHDHFVEAELFIVFGMLESKQATADKGLPEFVSEIACAIGGFDQDFDRSLVEPLSRFPFFLPGPSAFKTRVRGNVHRCSGQRQRAFAPGEPISDFSARTGCRAVEGLYRRWKIMRLCLQGDDRVKIHHLEKIRYVLAVRSKLFYARTFDEGHVVLISGDDEVGILFRGLFNKLKKG